MLRCIAACELPREPRQVCVLHHDIEGLIISAVRYNPHAFIDPESNALCYPPPAAEEYVAENNNNDDNDEEEENNTANYFTIVETAIPLTAAQPESFAATAYAQDTLTTTTTAAARVPVRTLTVPVPGVAIHALTLLHRENGREVYVLVQCAVEKEEPGKDGGAPGYDTAAYVFRRVLMHSSSEEDEDEEDEHEGDDKEADEHEGATTTTAGIQYVRMPRLVDDEHRTWTALTTLDTDLLPSAAEHTNNPDNKNNKSTSTTLGSASQASSQTSTSAAAVVVVAATQARTSGETALQVFAVSATRAERYATCGLPSLAGLQVTQLLPRPGLPRHLLLLCPHLIAEVELRMGHTEGHTHVMAVPTRVWRCGPQDVLLTCALKEHYLYAGTAEGTLLLWDTRLALEGNNGSNNNKCNNNQVEMNEEAEEDNDEGVGCMARTRKAALDEAEALIGAGEASTTAITGLHAVYATEFYTCAMDGAMRGWRYVQEGSLNDGFTTAQQGRDASHAQAVERMLGGTAAFVPVLEAEADMRVMYAGLNAAVSMAGVEHYMAVVHEEGQMRVYMSA